MFCPSCGTETAEGFTFCPSCGKALGEAAAPAGPVEIHGITFTPGSGPYAGLYSSPAGQWVRIVDGKIQSAKVAGQRSTGRVIGGVVAFIVAAFALIQGISWFTGWADLDAAGNPFAGTLLLLGLGAFAVAAGFGIWGIVLVSKK